MNKIIFFISIILISCSSSKEKTQPPVTNPAFDFPYQLANPKATFLLNKDLKEISGLSLSADKETLLTINDEEGKVFQLDKTTGEVLKKSKFHKKGDYEGIEVVGDKVYVLKHNGTLYEITNFMEDTETVTSYATDLNANNDVEGLGYDSSTGQLLLACKGKAGKGDFYKKKRAIYGFNLTTKKLTKEPILLLSRKEIGSYIRKSGNRLAQFLKSFSSKDASNPFAPSAIAVHPIDKNWYILSSVGKLLVVVDTNGTIQHIEKLDTSIYVQPEGICFEVDGTMYISSEGKNGKGKVILLSMK